MALPLLRRARAPDVRSHLWVRCARDGRTVASAARAWGGVRWGSGARLELRHPVAEVKGAEELVRVGWGGAKLWLRPGMTGALVLPGRRLPLEELEAWGFARGRPRARWVRIPLDVSAELNYRGLQLSVFWGAAPQKAPEAAPAAKLPTVPARFRREFFSREERPFALVTWGVYAGLALAVLGLASMPLPTAPKPEEVARRFARLIYEAPQAKTRARAEILKRTEKKAEEPPPAPEKKLEPEKPKPEESKPAEPRRETAEVAPGQAPSPVPGPEVPPDAARRREEVRQAVAKKGLLGLLGGRGAASTSTARGTLLEGRGAAQDLDKLLESVDGLQAAPTGGTGSGGTPAPSVARGLDDAARKVAAAPARAVQLEERAAQVVEAPVEAGLDERSLKEAIAVIHRTVGTYLGGLRYLYNRELRKNPDLEGKLTVSMTIDPEGAVTDARVVETTLDAPEFVAGVLERVRKWKFPPVAPRPLTVTYPFVFFPTM